MTSLADQFEALAKAALSGKDSLRTYAAFMAFCFENRTAISSALTATPPVQEGWRAIETAPKDGTYVLLRFEGPFHDSESPGAAVGRYYPKDRRWWVTCIWASSSPHRHGPTHWMPLPAAPEPTGVTPTGEMG